MFSGPECRGIVDRRLDPPPLSSDRSDRGPFGSADSGHPLKRTDPPGTTPPASRSSDPALRSGIRPGHHDSESALMTLSARTLQRGSGILGPWRDEHVSQTWIARVTHIHDRYGRGR